MAGYITIETEEITISEGQVEELCWSLTPPDLTFERSVNFIANAQPSTATDSDYGSFPQSMLPSPANDVCVNVTILEDNVIEENQVFQLELVTDSVLHFNDSSPIAQVSSCSCWSHLGFCVSGPYLSAYISLSILYVHLSVCLSVHLSICLCVSVLCLPCSLSLLSVLPSVLLFVYLSVRQSLCLPV